MLPRRPVARIRTARHVLLAIALMAQALVSACALPTRLAAVPANLTVQAHTDIPGARFYPDRGDPAFLQGILESNAREAAWLAKAGHTGPLPPVAYLTIWG